MLYSNRARMQTGAKLADVEYRELGGFDCNFGVIAEAGQQNSLLNAIYDTRILQ